MSSECQCKIGKVPSLPVPSWNYHLVLYHLLAHMLSSILIKLSYKLSLSYKHTFHITNVPGSFSGLLNNRLTGTEVFSLFSMRAATQTLTSYGAVISSHEWGKQQYSTVSQISRLQRGLSQYSQKLRYLITGSDSWILNITFILFMRLFSCISLRYLPLPITSFSIYVLCYCELCPHPPVYT